MIIYFEIQNSEFEFTFFHAQRNLSYQVLLLLVRSGMSLFMAVEETGSLMRVDIQSAADDVLEKWILCGDPDQIESVGCGSVFRDLLNSNTFCTVTLNQFMRQDAQSSIVQNCKKILEGDPDLIADEQFFIGRYESDEAAKRALLYYYPKDEDCMKHQILSTTKQGKVGTEVLNRTLEGPADADSLIYHDYVYRAGDKVVFVSNNYKAGYCNGDVGVITEIHNGMTVSLGDETVSLGEYDLDEILPADVITVHKSQGGEYEDVYVMLPEKPRVLLTRNILNTAVSRARKKVMLFTVRNSLSICVSNVMSHNRDTWLSIFFSAG